MPISNYLRWLREHVGSSLLLVPGVSAVIRDERGRVLLERRADDGRWGLPAGSIDPGESPADAIVREVWEETRLRVRPTRILAVLGGPACRHRYPNGDECEFTTIVFACAREQGEPHAKDGESTELSWFAPEEMPRLVVDYPSEIFGDYRGPTLFQETREGSARDAGREAR